MHQQNGVQQLIHSAPTIEKQLELCHSYAQNKAQKHYPKRIPWLLVALSNSNTFLITALDWLKKERKKMNNSDFWPFQVCPFKIVTVHAAITTVDWGKPFKLLCVLLDASICSLAMILL